MLYCENAIEFMPALGNYGAIITDPPIKAYWAGGRGFLHDSPWLDDALAIADTVMFTVSAEVAGKFPKPHQRITWRWDMDTPVFVYGLSADLPDVIEEPWSDRQAFGHGSCKPLPLFRRLVASTRGKVLDPFCGTGTTGVACKELDREFDGIEFDPVHIATALRRIATA